jgi:hypothetical protein
MKYTRGFLLLIAIVSQATIALAQTDWQAIRNLPEETPIAVTLKHARGQKHCWFQSASVDALTCDVDDRDHPHQVIYGRDEIRKIYRMPERRTPDVAGVVFSSIILLIFRNGAAAGAAGGLIGTALIVRHFNHGPLVYHSPSARNPGTGVAPAARN